MTDQFLTFLRPTAEKPLLGQTILAVEDSRCAGAALRLMALKSGARFRRADSLRAALRHLSTYRPTVVICDLGLPDGSGLSLLADLAAARPRVPALIALSGDGAAQARALATGADLFIEKPLAGIAAFQGAILNILPPDARPLGPRTLAEGKVPVDREALADDLAHVADLISSAEGDGTADYVAGFVAGLGRCAADDQLVQGAERLSRAMRRNEPFSQSLASLAGLVQHRLGHLNAAG